MAGGGFGDSHSVDYEDNGISRVVAPDQPPPGPPQSIKSLFVRSDASAAYFKQ